MINHYSTEKCFIDFQKELNRIRKLDTFNQKQFIENSALTRSQIYYLTEGAFFTAFRAYEHFIRNIFLLYCSGRQSNNHRKVTSLLNSCSLEQSESILQSSMPFIDWNSTEALIKRAKTYLKNGFPIKDVLELNLASLRDLRKVRNHIAHMSPASTADFNQVLKNHYGTVPINTPLTGEYLLMRKTSKSDYYLLEYLNLMEKVARQLA